MTQQSPAPTERWYLTEPAKAVGEFEVSYHPDQPGIPNSGAVKVALIDGLELHEIPRVASPDGRPIAINEKLPIAIDRMYGNIYAPWWVLAAVRAISAAVSMDVIPGARMVGAIELVASDKEIQDSIAAAARVGANPLEVFMIIDEKL